MICRYRLESPRTTRKTTDIKAPHTQTQHKKLEVDNENNTLKKSTQLRSKTLQPPRQNTLRKPDPVTKLKENNIAQRPRDLPCEPSIQQNHNTQPRSETLLSSMTGSGIQKPTAAVKGTTKSPEKHPTNSPLMSPDIGKRSIPCSPYTAHRSLSPSVLDPNSSQPLQRRILASKEDGGSGITVALVSPMPSRHRIADKRKPITAYTNGLDLDKDGSIENIDDLKIPISSSMSNSVSSSDELTITSSAPTSLSQNISNIKHQPEDKLQNNLKVKILSYTIFKIYIYLALFSCVVRKIL